MIFTSHEYVVRVTTFFECMSWIEWNAWEDKWFVSPKIYKKGLEKESKEGSEKKLKNKIDLVSKQYINICKLGVH